MIERGLFVESAGFKLAGTLCLPDAGSSDDFSSAAACPVVLMVHGSGPFDRDENSPGQALNSFNAIAHYLADRGIGSLRYDKRGCGESEGSYLRAGHGDLVADAYNWLCLLKSLPDCDGSALYVLGHSEGTAIGAQLAQRFPGLAGLVLLCPFVQNLEQILMQQAHTMERELAMRPGVLGVLPNLLYCALGANAQRQARVIRKVKNSSGDTVRIRWQKVPARWYRELFALDLQQVYQAVEVPTLLLGGTKDLQVNPGDINEIEQLVRAEVTAELVPDLTHVLRLEPGEATLVGSHRLLAQPVEPVVIEAVCIWIQERISDLA